MPENCVQNKVKYLNLGCGGHFSKDPEWLNMDIAPQDSHHVHQYQLQLGIPFSDCSFEGVYHSHILEHFPRGQVMPFLRECYRVLKPGGAIRIAVPDLEQILRAYLAALDAVRQAGEKGDPAAEDRLLWMQVELLDQLVRSRSGGMMGPAWTSANEELASFIRQRTGGELANIPRQPVAGPLHLPEQELAIETPDLNFLASGEKHCWMYDATSLGILLRQAGFAQVREVGCKTGSFGDFQPDAMPDGSARKPDSCFVEAVRPDTAKAEGPRIAIFSTTDRGGAGIAAMRLQAGLRHLGANSIAYLQYKATTQPNIYVLPPSANEKVLPMGKGAALSANGNNLLAKALSKYPDRPRDCEMFSISEANTRLENIPQLADAEIINLHWVATFLDIPADTRFLKGKKIVWTLHDMNPFTGGCHYADGCEGFLQKCGNCPQLGSDKDSDLSRQNWKRREYSYRNLDITVVTPSRWLADEARRSSLFGRFPVHIIPNGLPIDVYRPYPKAEVRKAIGIAEDAKVLLFTADNVLNKRKGLVYLLEALETLHTRPEANNIVLMLLGNGGENISDLGYQVKALGNLDSPVAMAAAYSAADAVVLPTLEDNLPNVLLEALACGTPAVTFNVGGVPDIIDHLQTGYLAKSRDASDLAQGLLWAITDKTGRSRLCRAKAMEKYPLEKQANAYHALFQNIASEKRSRKKTCEVELTMADQDENHNTERMQQTRLLRVQAATALQKNELDKAHNLLALAKSLRTPLENIDYLRAMAFLKKGEIDAAREAAKEELRYFPQNQAAIELLQQLHIAPPKLNGPEEFQTLCRQILPYTMVGPLRLQALYEHAVDICKNGPEGNFVECGVAGGGSSGLISAVIKQYGNDRRLFACDSFSGMPDSGNEDVSHDGKTAQASGWGAGTCAAPESSVLGLCEKLGTRDIITTIKGYFEDTLPVHAESFGPIAFLHMDGDWYSSTKTILENLFDRLVPGAYVQVDDFGHWTGCRKAVKEFICNRKVVIDMLKIDNTGAWFKKKIVCD